MKTLAALALLVGSGGGAYYMAFHTSTEQPPPAFPALPPDTAPALPPGSLDAQPTAVRLPPPVLPTAPVQAPGALLVRMPGRAPMGFAAAAPGAWVCFDPACNFTLAVFDAGGYYVLAGVPGNAPPAGPFRGLFSLAFPARTGAPLQLPTAQSFVGYKLFGANYEPGIVTVEAQ